MEVTSILNPATQQSEEILHLFYIVLIVAGIIFTVVASLVIYSSIRFRHREGGPEPSQVTGNRKLEIIWTVIPTLIVAFLFVLTVEVMHMVNPPMGKHEPDLVVTAHQWWWALHYPQSGVTTANELHLPVRRQLLLRVLSADVDHDFWVPAFGKKVDAIPNHPNHLWVNINKPGVYLGTCDEFCGAEHAWMRIRVVAQTTADYDAWTLQQSQPAPPPSGAEAERGFNLFMARTCANCHAIRGTQAEGNVAPDLTHLASRQTLASGVFDNTPENLFKWLKDPQAIKPGCDMPDLHLPDNEVKALVAYLGELK